MLSEQSQAIEFGHFRSVAFGFRDCHSWSSIKPNLALCKVVIRTVAHTPLDSTFETTFQDSHRFSKKELSAILWAY